jgi:hypothetical protein
MTASQQQQQQFTGDLNCDFEGNCNWLNRISQADTKFWLHTKAASLGIHDGPSVDHTLETNAGGLLVFSNANASSYYVSPTISGYKCFEFWYYIYRSNVS